MIYRIQLASNCPDCGRRLRVNRRKRDGVRFVGCTGFPRCDFVEDLEDQNMLERLHDLEIAVKALASERREQSAAWAPGLTKRASDKLRELIAWAHPDKHPDGTLSAHEVTVKLNLIRKELAA